MKSIPKSPSTKTTKTKEFRPYNRKTLNESIEQKNTTQAWNIFNKQSEKL